MIVAGLSAGAGFTQTEELAVQDWTNGIHSQIFMFAKHRLYGGTNTTDGKLPFTRNARRPQNEEASIVNMLFESIHAE